MAIRAYGHTRDAQHLPQSSSINKQITYGEYIASMADFRQRFGDHAAVYNAFLMPYSMFSKKFPSAGELQTYRHIGEAVCDWRPDGKNEYEHVQGILIDVRSLMHNYVRHSEPEMAKLADLIESSTKAALFENLHSGALILHQFRGFHKVWDILFIFRRILRNTIRMNCSILISSGMLT